MSWDNTRDYVEARDGVERSPAPTRPHPVLWARIVSLHEEARGLEALYAALPADLPVEAERALVDLVRRAGEVRR